MARLAVSTAGAHRGRPVVFTAAGTSIAAGRRFAGAVVLFGDGAKRRLHSLRAAFRHTYRRIGVYRVTLTVRDSRGHRSAIVRHVAVVNRNAVVLRQSAVRLQPRDLVSATPVEGGKESLTLASHVPAAPGQTLLFPASPNLPRGLAVVVEDVQPNADGSTAVAGHDASLSEIYSRLTYTGRARARPRVDSLGAGLRRGRLVAASARHVPFDCTQSGKPSVSVSADLSKTYITPTIDMRARIFQLDAIVKPTFSLGVAFSGSAKCELSGGFGLDFPIPSVPGLVMTISPYFTLEANGKISANASWQPAVFLDVTSDQGRINKFLQFNSKADASASGSAAVTLEGGIDVQVSVAKRAGLDARLGPKLTAVASATTSTRGSSACLDVSSAIDASVGLFARVLFVNADVTLYRGEFFKSTLVHKCAGGSAPVGGSGDASGSSSGGAGTTVGAPGSGGGGYYGSPSVTASNNAGQLAIRLSSFPIGRTYYFCHAGGGYPTGGAITGHGEFYVTTPNQSIPSGLCSGTGNFWIGLQAPNGHDYYSNQVTLGTAPQGSVSASNNNGQMAVQLSNFPTGTTYYFCHAGDASQYPTGGVVTAHGSVNISSPNQNWSSGLCSGGHNTNMWIGFQGTDGHDYYSNQVIIDVAATPGAGVSASNNNGQMAVQVTGFPTGTTYFFCHAGDASQYPTGGTITAHGAVNITSPNQSWSSGLCSGGHNTNMWIGFQGTDGHDYYSNQVVIDVAATPGASASVFGSNGQMSLQLTNFPVGTNYYFCHQGDPSQYPYGGTIIGRGRLDTSSPNGTYGPLCSGSGNAWIGVQGADGHDYYSNQITL